MRIGGAATLRSYGVSPPTAEGDAAALHAIAAALQGAMPPEHLRFLRGLPVSAQFGDYLFVHAGLRPGRTLERQSETDMLSIRDPFLSSKARWPFVVVHGHSPTTAVFQDERRIGIDTGAYATGRLTAVHLRGAEVKFLST